MTYNCQKRRMGEKGEERGEISEEEKRVREGRTKLIAVESKTTRNSIHQ